MRAHSFDCLHLPGRHCSQHYPFLFLSLISIQIYTSLHQLERLIQWIHQGYLTRFFIDLELQSFIKKMDYHQIQPQQNESTIQQILQQQEKMELCNCGSSEKVMFQCDEELCPNFQRQRLFCPMCLIPSKHSHIPVLIAARSKNVTDEWTNLRQEIKRLKQSITEWMETHGALTQLLDEFFAKQDQTFQFKLEQFDRLTYEVENFYQQNIAESSAKGEVLKLQEFNYNLKDFNERLEKFGYLNQMGTRVLWILYSEIIHLISYQLILERLSDCNSNVEYFLKLRLQKLENTLFDIFKERKISTVSRFNILENQTLRIDQFVQCLQQRIKDIKQKSELSNIDLVIIEDLRVELDKLGMAKLFQVLSVKVNEKHKRLEERLIQKQQKFLAKAVAEIKEELQREAKQNKDQLNALTQRMIFSGSNIINDTDQVKTIQNYFEQAQYPLMQPKLLYRGSFNTFQASVFHRLCDYRPNTLTIVKTTKGEIIGGFTSQTWNGDRLYKQDDIAWLFNLKSPTIFKIQVQNRAIFAEKTLGPTFGGQNDLYISDNCNQNSYSLANAFAFNYNDLGNVLLQQDQQQFQVSDLEVFQV